MNIIYFTTSQQTKDFNDYLKLWKSPINSSNQIFHNKFIRALSINNHVDVISIRPFSKKKCSTTFLKKKDTVETNIHWHYPKISGSKLTHINSLKLSIGSIFKTLYKKSVIITDTINPSVLYLATKFAKKYDMPIIGVCTDSPSNITGTTRTYTLLLLKLAKSLDGYIALTTGLNELYNDNDKPALIFEGIVENSNDIDDDAVEPNRYGKYIFYSGALNERFGIYNLINFFKNNIKDNTKLVMCGHHADEDKLKAAIKEQKRIVYLGNITNEEVISLERNAWCNINPRPYNEDLDRYSIPSKVLEYLNSDTPTISVKNTKLQKYFNPYLIWIKSNQEEDFLEGINKLNELSKEEYETMAKNAKELAQKYYSINAISDKVHGFLYYLLNNKAK